MFSILKIKKKAINLYVNSRGWRTDRKLVVIESDDWGSIRTPSTEVYTKFLKLGFPLDTLSYHRFDSLESNKDLESLFEVLISIKDNKGNNPIFTANTIMTNPDFDKIRSSNYKLYHYELFTETLKKYPQHNKVLDLFKEGIENKIFQPQLHGREHLNINRWMLALQHEKSNVRMAFENGFYDLSISHEKITNDSFVDALSLSSYEELDQQKGSIVDATHLFKQVFGFEAKSFIAPVYIWRPEIEHTLFENGIKYIQSNVYQKIPKVGRTNFYSKKLHYTGEENKYKQIYTVRNSFFEPSSNNASDSVVECMNQVERSFRNRKPAIISSHRLNYIGFLNIKNRKDNLLLLRKLLLSILAKWPEAEFISSVQLGDIIKQSKHE